MSHTACTSFTSSTHARLSRSRATQTVTKAVFTILIMILIRLKKTLTHTPLTGPHITHTHTDLRPPYSVYRKLCACKAVPRARDNINKVKKSHPLKNSHISQDATQMTLYLSTPVYPVRSTTAGAGPIRSPRDRHREMCYCYGFRDEMCAPRARLPRYSLSGAAAVVSQSASARQPLSRRYTDATIL